MTQKTKADYAWAAGFFDGEGHVGEDRLVVQQNVPEPLYVLRWLFGGSVLGPYTRERRREPGVQSKPYWVWRCGKAHGVAAIHLMLPHMRVKGPESVRFLERCG